MGTLLELIQIAASHSDINSDRFNEALADIQNMMGQEDGDFAGVWFSEFKDNHWAGLETDERVELLILYVGDELRYLATLVEF